MEYFYTPPRLIARNHLVIDGDEFSHLTHVMRKRIGDELRVVDGKGNAYDAVIASIEAGTARCEIRAHHIRLNEEEKEVSLAVGLLKNASKFDFLVEKAAELGVTSIVPLLTERTIPRHAKIERWQKLALAAMKQSCRCILPLVSQPKTFTEFVSSSDNSGLQLIPHEKAEKSLQIFLAERSTHRTKCAIVICVGPEGGFSNAEIEQATERGFSPVSLGPRRLRTETAAIVSVAAIVLASG